MNTPAHLIFGIAAFGKEDAPRVTAAAHYGGIVAPIEVGLCVVLSVVLWRRFTGWRMRALIAALAAAQVVPGILWAMMFAGG